MRYFHALLVGLAAPSLALAQFGNPLVIHHAAAGAMSVRVADLDGDGDEDVLWASVDNDEVAWSENLGGSFGPKTVIGTEGDGARDVRAADLDGDGDLDVAAASWNDKEVYWYENQGGGAFGPALLLDVLDVGPPRDLELADLDLDGDLEVITTEYHKGEIYVYENLGTGAFGPRIVAAQGLNGALGIEVGWIDGDDLPDLVGLGFNLPGIRWYANRGGLSFEAPQPGSAYIDEPADFDLADMDADGDLDTVWVTGFAQNIAWSSNDGQGHFSANQTLASLSTFGLRIDAEDADADGDPDLFVCLAQFEGYDYYENLGGAQLDAPLEVANASQASDTTMGDLDGDGDLDLVSSTYGSGRIAWHATSLLPTVGATYCGPAVENSAGTPGEILATGSVVVADDDFTLGAYGLPHGQFGYFLASLAQGLVHAPPGSVGTLCLGGAIGRFTASGQVLDTGPGGVVSLTIGTQAMATPHGTVPALPGETWRFQLWYRDTKHAASNFTDATAVLFQ